MAAALIINPGSSSKKFALFVDGQLLVTWLFENTGHGFTVCTEKNGTKSLCENIDAAVFKHALKRVLTEAVEAGYVQHVAAIERVGIRIVAPAAYFTEHRVVDDECIRRLIDLEPLAPHHIPEIVSEIEVVRRELPDIPLIGVSDSAFHVTASETQKATSLPPADAATYDMYRFGYHGLSVASVVRHVTVKEGSVPPRMVVCHVGSGVSVTGVHHGKSIGNSMGYTPTSGVMMSSRMGDLPADMLAGLMVRKGLNKADVFNYLYNEGGFKSLTGVRDLRLVLDRADKHDHAAQFALQLFAEEVRAQIAKYAMFLGGLDMIVLTATAVERNPVVRSLLVGELPLLNTYIHNDRNDLLMSKEGYIQSDESAVKILVLKTDELGEMYRVVTGFKVG